MVMQNESGRNTHGKGEWVKIPLLPEKVGKKSVNDSGPTTGSQHLISQQYKSNLCFIQDL